MQGPILNVTIQEKKAPERKRDHGYKHGWFLWGLIPRPHASVGLRHSHHELQGLWEMCSSLCPEENENVFWPTRKFLLHFMTCFLKFLLQLMVTPSECCRLLLLKTYSKHQLSGWYFYSSLQLLIIVFYNYLFIWLHQVLVTAHRIFLASCGIFHSHPWTL